MKLRPTSAVTACAAAAALLCFSLPGQAAFVASTTASDAGFTTNNTTLAFNEAGLAAGTAVTNQYSGVTFTAGMYQNPFSQGCSGFAHFSDPCIGNFPLGGGAITGLFTIIFDSSQTEAGFNIATNTGTTLFEALLGSTLVESASAATSSAGDASTINFFGFNGITFDRIRVTPGSNGAAVIDNLTFDQAEAPVPEPGSLALAGLALGTLVLAARRRRPD
jgi:hypothetical protein